MRHVLIMVAALVTAASSATAAEVCAIPAPIDGDTFRLGATEFRLDGIDAPEPNQVCLDDAGHAVQCGALASDALAGRIGGKRVCCEDKGRDWKYKDRRIGLCRLEDGGEKGSLNRWLVHQGWAIDFMPYSCERFKEDEGEAQRESRGLWDGCFLAPRAFRYSDLEAPLLGNKCSHDEKVLRRKLLGIEETGPNGCIIKGKAHRIPILTKGIYHMPGCSSYRVTGILPARGDQWFCTEADAVAARFRKAKNCKSNRPPPKSAVKCD